MDSLINSDKIETEVSNKEADKVEKFDGHKRMQRNNA